MISVVIPTHNSEVGLGMALTALVPAAVEGIVREVIVVDGGSADRTLQVADQAGVDVVSAEPVRGKQLRMGAARARSNWLLFLHPDTVLEHGWEYEASQFMERIDSGRRRRSAAAFRFTIDDTGLAPRALEAIVALRTGLLRRSFGDQGLLIPRNLYDETGGFAPLPVMEDVDLVRRLGRRRLVVLRSRALTSSLPYRRDGYVKRVMRNQAALALYHCRVPVRRLTWLYS
jgi:rSAM/selenodomain-associated transferase 2